VRDASAVRAESFRIRHTGAHVAAYGLGGRRVASVGAGRTRVEHYER
jgi:hypothetical protein